MRICSFLAVTPQPKGTGHGSLHSTLAAGGSDPHHHSSRSILALNAAMAMTSNREAVRVPEQSVESSASAVEWAAIAGGALAAIGISIIISTLASGAGLAAVRPWSFSEENRGLHCAKPYEKHHLTTAVLARLIGISVSHSFYSRVGFDAAWARSQYDRRSPSISGSHRGRRCCCRLPWSPEGASSAASRCHLRG